MSPPGVELWCVVESVDLAIYADAGEAVGALAFEEVWPIFMGCALDWCED